MSSIAAITLIPLRGALAPVAIIPLMPATAVPEIHVGNNQQRPQILVPAVNK